MKTKIFISVLLLLFSCDIINAQCVNNVSTNPYNPSNNSLPDIGSGAPYNYDQRYLNGFDWWSPSYYTLTNMQYNQTQPYGNMSNIQSPSILSSYNYLNKGLDAELMLPQNGWELLLINLGFYPDNVTQHSEIDLQTVPYIVLYNKYKGIIRVFVQYGYNQTPPDAVSGVKINLKYKSPYTGNLSGILRLAEGNDKALDQTTTVSIISTVASPNGATNFWMSGDFQLAYDPCVCFYPTNITLDFEFFSTTNFKLYGRGIGVNEPIVNNNIVNSDFLSGVDFSSTTDADNGYVIYKDMQNLAEDYINKMEDYKQKLENVNVYNDEVEKKLLVIKVFKMVLVGGLAAATGQPELAALAINAPDLVFSGDSIGEAHKEAFYDEAGKILGEELNTYISENLKKKPDPTKPTMPTATFSEMNFEGQLTTKLPIQGPLFNTPGSFVNNEIPNFILNEPAGDYVYGYPIYNEALGQFALLNSPKIKLYKKSIDTIEDRTCADEINGFPVFYKKIKWSEIYQFQLANDLKYTFNPALDIVDYNIKACLVVKMKNDTLTKIFPTGTFCYEDSLISLNDVTKKANFESISFNTNINDTINKFDTTSLTLASPYVPIDAFYPQVSSIGFTNSYEGDLYGLSDFFGNGLLHQIISIKLKLLVEVEYSTLKDDGSPNHYLYGYTYNISPNDIINSNTFIVPEQNIPDIDVQFPSNDKLFNNTYFNGQNVQGCVLNGNLYRCATSGNITIDGDITVGNGYHVDFVAGNEIYVINESDISPEAVLMVQNDPMYDYTHPMPPATNSFISDFCNSLGDITYKGNLKGGKLQGGKLQAMQDSLQQVEQEEKIKEQMRQDFDFSMYPNPTTNQANIIIDRLLLGGVTISVKDVAGKTIEVLANQQNDNTYVIDVNNLESGIYFVTVSSFGYSKTKRLVITK